MLFILSVLLLATVDYSYQWSILPKFLSRSASNQMAAVNESAPQIIDSKIVEYVKLSTAEIITKYGYVSETHHVTTEDGYILELHRIAGGPKSPPSKGKKVCLLVHGLTISSTPFVIPGPSHAIAFRLADEGYDIWMTNNRGNFYSINHTTLNAFGSRKERQQYWAFSLDEIALLDIPSSIDYVLNKTEQTKLQYFGHSLGSTVFFMMTADKPEYNDKIEMMHALAPPVFLSNIGVRPVRAAAAAVSSLQKMNKLLGLNYVDGVNINQKIFRDLVGSSLNSYMGDSEQTNPILMSVLAGYLPKRASFLQLLHYFQMIKTGRFQHFDYGRTENLARYNSSTAPEYNLKNCVAPVAIYYGKTDYFTVVDDVKKLISELPNVVKDYLIPREKFNHVDFVFGNDAPTLLYDEIVKTIKSI